MLHFKALTLEDRDLINTYLSRSKYLTCEYSFTTLYIWRKALNTTWCVYKDSLIIKKYSPCDGNYFMQPIGYAKKDLKDILSALITYQKEHHMEYLFRDAEEPFIGELKNLMDESLLEVSIEEDNFDYIYESAQLISLSGRKFSGKRNHYSRFVKSYDYRIEEISPANAAECIEASKRWCQENGCDGFLSYEMHSIIDMLENQSKLGFYGIVVYVDNMISAFTIGEVANEDMAIIHIEKAFTDYHGLYTFINKTFAEMYFKDIRFINREEDMGLEGLRKAKQSYHPFKLEYKYTVNLKEQSS